MLRMRFLWCPVLGVVVLAFMALGALPADTVEETDKGNLGGYGAPAMEGRGQRLGESAMTEPCEDLPVWSYRIVRTLPHDIGAFTQGLIHLDGFLYESTGLLGRSTLRRIDAESGEVLQSISLPDKHFGEGLTHWGDRLIQGTWKSGIVFLYGRKSMDLLEELPVFKECWGLTQDGNSLIMSDGSDRLYFLDPVSFAQRRVLEIGHCGASVWRLNELEYVKGEVLANVWQEDVIARISPVSGQVLGWVDLSGLRRELGQDGGAEVLNGIAYDAQRNRVFVTGKLWPKLFEVEFVPPESPSTRR